MYECVRKRLVNKFELKNLMYNKKILYLFYTDNKRFKDSRGQKDPPSPKNTKMILRKKFGKKKKTKWIT